MPVLTPPSAKRRKLLDERQSEVEARLRGEKPVVEDRRRAEYRTEGQRDRDRVLYCSALQRLAYVTQVTAPESGYTFHNRLSHSLKVAQVGRRHAERLRAQVKRKEIVGRAARIIDAIDPDSVEAACLAHDLGHPPFGHLAEKVLDREASKFVRDGFEGNAQSFRIVTRLAIRDDRPFGLDLTRRTLDGVLKYPWQKRKSDRVGKGKRTRKWGYYDEDTAAYGFAREGLRPDTRDSVPERSIEAEIMDWADDLTYAVHDMDDFFCAGVIPLDRLGDEGTPEFRRFKELLRDAEDTDPDAFLGYEVDELAEAARKVINRHGPDEPYRHTRDARAAMRDFGSTLITDYLDAFSFQDVPKSPKVRSATFSTWSKGEVGRDQG